MKEKLPTSIARVLAWGIDLLIIAIYAVFLFTIISPHVKTFFTSNPITAELMGFVLLTSPAYTYLSLSETLAKATIGKKMLRIKIYFEKKVHSHTTQIFLRNAIKLLPWELAHFSIWNCFVFTQSPFKIYGYGALILCYMLIIIYIVMLFKRSGRTLYDIVSETSVGKVNK